MKFETTTYLAIPIYSNPLNKMRFKFRTVSLCESRFDTIGGVNITTDEEQLAKCFDLIDHSSDEVSSELEVLATVSFKKAIIYFQRELTSDPETRTWKGTIDSAMYDIPIESNVEILLGMYGIDDHMSACTELYFLGVIFRNFAKDGDDLTSIPVRTFATTFVTNCRGNTLCYDTSTQKFSFKQILPLTTPRSLMPLASHMHPEIRDLDKIEDINDGLCLKEYFKSNGNKFDVKFETMDSGFIKPAIKELLSNFSNLDKVRIYREVGTIERKVLEEQLEDYTISDNMLAFRNGAIGFPDIDNTGHYIENKPKYMSLNEVEQEMGLIKKPDPSILFEKEDC